MKSKKQIEVEIRGMVSYRQLKILGQKLKKEGKFLGRKKQAVIFFQENKILKLPKDSLRIKKDETGMEVYLKLKTGQEIELLLRSQDYKKAIAFFHFFGFVRYSIAPALREDYLYRGAIISLKWRCIIGPHFEIEKIVSAEKEIAKTRKKLLTLTKHLGLEVWSDKEYLEYKSRAWDLYKCTGQLR